ncbi:MAG: trypsin-like peptidase domain-containing protein [Planctomycetota bacterium]|nr:trypsin-like peptidase domain-containing protein [Planctomycetota bacterium]
MLAYIWLSCYLFGQIPAAPVAAPAIDKKAIVSALESVVADSIEMAQESVVAISPIRRTGGSVTNAVKGKTAPIAADFRPMTGVFDPMSQDFQSFDYGSGVVIGPQGQILTAFHIVQGSDLILVRAAKHQEFYAEVIASDPRSDLAVIVPKTLPVNGIGKPPVLKPIKLGNSDKLRLGSFLVALGNPFNSAKDGQSSAAFGILSNRARRLDLNIEEGVTGRQLRHLPTLLQLDSKLNLGMSGGALVNMMGELVGLTTTGGNPQSFDAQAGYAIPIDALTRRSIASLIEGRSVEYGFLGVSLNASGNNVINGVSPATPAAKAGLMSQDEIIAVGDFPITDGDTLVLAVNSLPVETPVKIRIRRDGREITKDLILAKFPVTGEVIATNKPVPWRGIEVDYPSVGAINQGPLAELPLLRTGQPDHDGVLVTRVEQDSPAFGLLKIGTLIVSVNDKPVKSPREFRDAVENLKGQVRLKTPDSDFEIPE